MARTTRKTRRPRRKSKAPRVDKAEAITNTIIEALEGVERDGSAWAKPWQTLARYGLPRNGNSGRQYRGICNLWMLLLKGHNDPRWYTYQGAQKVGGQVRGGEKGTAVFAWDFFPQYVDANGDRVRKPSKADIASGKVRCIGRKPWLKTWTLFNAEQCDGIPAMPEAPQVDPAEVYEVAVAALDALPATVRHGSNSAHYNPSDDSITLPEVGQFVSVEAYLATRFHETGHWTGHKSRLARDLSGRFGSDSYAMEELVAELTSAFLCGHFGVEGQGLQHPEYLASWLKVLKADKHAIFQPARLATEASNFVLAGGVKAESDTDDADASEGDQPVAQAA
jgi:antirestriction protein ArdC